MSDSYDSMEESKVHPLEEHSAKDNETPDIGLATRDGAIDDAQVILTGDKSPGVARIEAINKHLTFWDRVALFIGVFCIGYAYGLDASVRYTYQTYALSSFSENGLISTVNVVRTVIGAAAQPTAAKIADVFGRLELLYVSVFFYVIGTILEAAAPSVGAFAAGAVLYQVGYTLITLLVEVIVADVSSLRSRLTWSYISVTPYIINAWISGDVASSVYSAAGWRWGIGMWAIIYPVMALPLILALLNAQRRARKCGDLANYKTPYQHYGFSRMMVALFWQLDVTGIVLMCFVFGLILVPFTLAGGAAQTWGTAHIIAPLVIGICLIPVFIIYEKWAKHPLVPFHLLKDRGVWGALGIAWMLDFAWYMQDDYLYNLLVVSFNQSTKAATIITSLYSFTSVVTGSLLSFLIRFGIPYLKPFILFGTCMFMVSFGILIAFRGDPTGGGVSGVIAGQVLLGFAGGFFTYPTQVSIQAATKHEHLALVTGLYLALYSIGSAFGTSVSGAIWTQTMPGKLLQNFEAIGATDPATLAASAYGAPTTFILTHPVGSPIRSAMILAYKEVQRLLCITGICLCVPLIFFALVLRNPRMTAEQSLAHAEERSDAEASGSDVESKGGVKKNTRLGWLWK